MEQRIEPHRFHPFGMKRECKTKTAPDSRPSASLSLPQNPIDDHRRIKKGRRTTTTLSTPAKGRTEQYRPTPPSEGAAQADISQMESVMTALGAS